MRWLPPKALAAVSVAMVVAAGCGQSYRAAPPDAGTPLAVGSATTTVRDTDPATVPPALPDPGIAAASPSGESNAATPPPAGQAPAEPTALTVANATATVVPIGVDGARALDVPGDVGTLGWWRDGALAGSPQGFVVITGHATRDGHAPANLWWELEPGDEVTVSTADGDLTYQVTARTSYPYDDMPYDRWFPAAGPTGEPALALITCSDFRDGVWHANTVVEAVPLPA